MTRIKIHISNVKLPFYPPCEVKYRLQNGVSTMSLSFMLGCISPSSPPSSQCMKKCTLDSYNSYSMCDPYLVFLVGSFSPLAPLLDRLKTYSFPNKLLLPSANHFLQI